MAIQPRTVTVSIEIQASTVSLSDIKATVRSVVSGAALGDVRTVQVNAVQRTKRRAKKAKR